ncbi:hypothetical protein CBL_14477 [Carabus blaptoides fortunei]
MHISADEPLCEFALRDWSALSFVICIHTSISKMALLSRLNNPPNWSYQSDETEEIELDSGTSQYKTIKGYMPLSLLRNGLRVCRLQNPYLYHRYMLRKAEYVARGIPVTEQTLVHATASHKVDSIIQNNLDWRLVCRDKYGKGVSFATNTAYANKECSKFNGYNRAMLFAKVLIGNKFPGYQSRKLPPDNYDTTTGNTNVIVKYYDDEFYPEHVAYYNLI